MQKCSKVGYVAYYRVSTGQQGQSGLGLDAQREAVTRFAGKLPILAEYIEIESGRNHTNRSQLLAALKHAKRAKACLLIAKLDRLARNVHFISGLMESGVNFVAADIPQASPLAVHIMAAFAEHEREMISQRTVAALKQVQAEIQEKGFRISKRSGKRFTKLGNPNWEEPLAKARAAKRQLSDPATPLDSMQRYRKDGFTLRDIASRLNAQGVKTRSGHAWYASTVRQVLINAA